MMDKKYRKILEKALPYYEQGRKGDIQHVKWLANIVLRYADSKVNKDVLMGLVILHDIGYSKVKGNPFNLKVRRKHQDEGAKIAGKVLKELGWKKEKVLRVQMLVKKHDDWHSWKKVEPELKLFHNFDFMWMASKKGYDIVRKFVNKSRKQFYNQILKWVDEESWEWYNKKVECCFRRLMRERKKELLI